MPILNRNSMLLLLALLATGATVAAPSQESQAVATIQMACDALRTGDIGAIKKLLMPGFVLIGSDVQMQSRDDIVAEMKRGDPVYRVFRNHSTTARVYGDAAVVWGITTIKGRAGGKRFAVELRFTDTLIRSDGAWRMVASHASRIPAE